MNIGQLKGDIFSNKVYLVMVLGVQLVMRLESCVHGCGPGDPQQQQTWGVLGCVSSPQCPELCTSSRRQEGSLDH